MLIFILILQPSYQEVRVEANRRQRAAEAGMYYSCIIFERNLLSVTECIVCVSGYDSLTFLSCCPFPFWLGGSFMAPII